MAEQPEFVGQLPRQIWQGAALLLVLFGIPLLLASTAPVLRTLGGGSTETLQADRQPALEPFESPRPLMASRQPTLRPPEFREAARPMSRTVETEPAGKTLLAVAFPSPQRQPVGALRTAGEVYLNESRVPPEATVYPGDALRTGANGNAALEVPGKGTILISQHTQISFAGAAGYFAALKQGSINVRTLAAVTNFEIQIGNFVVMPDPGVPEAGADIDRAVDGSTQVRATVGSVGVVDLEGPQTVFIRAGETVTVTREGRLLRGAPLQAQAQPQPGAPTAPAAAKKKSHAGWILLGVAGGGAAGVAAALAGGRGKSQPVSPSVP